ncbi:hypothetical protein DIURU_002113 [Diutina rugosa]|uniref:AP-3 complex subunit delta n=1 Tax=Diutina rugosa TaxID=5481 RepID=A0A642URL4_DIURU|nr:uncharacterized protein DIURU_002113 [Diutina rugosa]KAA8903891.1 hypothetical protein DIURU_002113 [Diutina rugosa]
MNNEVLARLKPFGISFEKSLNDLIKGIRSKSKDSPEALSQFIDAALAECRSELRQTDLETKAMAILKLAYLEMYGFDMSWANFSILEVMSSNNFQYKRIGYLAAIQSFKNEQDLLILATNQFKKDLNSKNHAEIGLALSGIATIVTPNLSKDINDDVLMKLSHSNPYVRKKAILAMYKIFLQFPDSLRQNFSRIIEKLDDNDVAVVSACVNVICEISKKNPKIFVNYLPKFFTILEETKNNWLIIRILKLFQLLSRVEPRMKKKIMPSILDLMLKTQASSLVYECINCIVQGNMLSSESGRDRETAKLCVNQLMDFFKTKDSNLKFVGLLALINILKVFPSLITSVNGVDEVIMECLTDQDQIIKRKALQICQYLVNEDNITKVVKNLLFQLIPKDFAISEQLKLEVALKIVSLAQDNNYANIPNFRWYVAVLKDVINLTLLPPSSKNTATNIVSISPVCSSRIAVELGREFKSLATKVPSIRSVILTDVAIPYVKDSKIFEVCPALLVDLLWVLGEYCEEFDHPLESDVGVQTDTPFGLCQLIEAFNFIVDVSLPSSEIAQPHESERLLNILGGNPELLKVTITTLVKVFSSICSHYQKVYVIDGSMNKKEYLDISYYLSKLTRFLMLWEHHYHYEVQERALSWLEFLRICSEALEVAGNSLLDTIQFETAGDGVTDSRSKVSEYESVRGGKPYENFENQSQQTGANSDLGDSSRDEEDNRLENQYKLPFLLTNVFPSLFKSYALNPVAKSAQRSITIPHGLNLGDPINSTPQLLPSRNPVDAYKVYDENLNESALISLSDDDMMKNQRKERLERQKDDPYYIMGDDDIRSKSGSPIGQLSDVVKSSASSISSDRVKKQKAQKLKKEKVKILSEETVEGFTGFERVSSEEARQIEGKRKKKNQIAIDSSKLDGFELGESIGSRESNTLEYDADDVNLDEIRKNLLKVSIGDNIKSKKKRSKKGKKDDKVGEQEPFNATDKQVTSTKLTLIQQEHPDIHNKNQAQSEYNEHNVIEFVKPKKKKKKKAAVISD